MNNSNIKKWTQLKSRSRRRNNNDENDSSEDSNENDEQEEEKVYKILYFKWNWKNRIW